MDAHSDDDFDVVSEFDMSESEDECALKTKDTPSSTPQGARTPRRSDLKTIHCTFDGCHKTFNRQARLQEHLRSHTNTRPFKCSHAGCAKAFLRETHLKHHLKSAHSNVRDYLCEWQGCDKSFATGTRLRRHIKAHEGKEQFACKQEGCNQTFRKHDTLAKHIISVHKQLQPFPCKEVDTKTGKQCVKAYDTAQKLKVHKQHNHDATRFSCSDCLAIYAAQLEAGTLQDHVSPPDAYFATYSELQEHIKDVHPPQCQYCPTSFTTAKELKRHLELQHGIIDSQVPQSETFPCVYRGCQQSFTKKGNLSVHVKTVHEKRKDFVCGKTSVSLPDELAGESIEIYGCGREFTSKGSLEEHVRTAHLGLPSRRSEREKKRKVERRDEENSEYEEKPKRRRERKDKGVMRGSALTHLTGLSMHESPARMDHDSRSTIAAPPVRTVDDSVPDTYPQFELDGDIGDDFDQDDEEEPIDDWNQLSGSMTIMDGQLFHNGRGYHYSNGQYPPGLEAPEPGSLHNSRRFSGVDFNDVQHTYADAEPFFDNFEHEPESLNGLLDPALLKI